MKLPKRIRAMIERGRPRLPELPPRAWSPRTIAAWEAWRRDPVTRWYGPADVAAAIELAWVHDEYVEGNEKASEVRMRMDGLGLTPKGKRDLRWRVAPTMEQLKRYAEELFIEALQRGEKVRVPPHLEPSLDDVLRRR